MWRAMASEVPVRRRGLKALGCGCCAGLLAVCVLVALALVACTRCVVSFCVASSLTHYARLVERADIDSRTREELLDQLERIRAQARRGEHVGFFSWLSYDESIRGLIQHGPITDRDAAAFKRELDRMEAEIDQGPDEQPGEEEPAAPELVRARPPARPEPLLV